MRIKTLSLACVFVLTVIPFAHAATTITETETIERRIITKPLATAPVEAPAVPDTARITDAEIVRAIEGRLMINDVVYSPYIDITAENGIVTLSGTVNSLLAEDVAVDIAQSTIGVREVINKLTVSEIDLADDVILQDIQRAFQDNATTVDLQIQTTVTEGNVVLQGTVKSWVEKMAASDVARSVRGVRSVTNQLEVVVATQRLDADIAADVRRALDTAIYIVNPSAIEATVLAGVVTLTGPVRTVTEKQRALMRVWAVPGVKDVVDQTTVTWWTSPTVEEPVFPSRTDKEIEKQIADALLADPYLGTFKIGVDMEGRFVVLTGIVDSLEARLRAIDIAQNVSGVYAVRDLIRIRPVGSLTDQQIMDNVRSALVRDPLIGADNINVVVRNARVYLSGTVFSSYERQRAAEVASRLAGVFDVNNYLIVQEQWEPKSDWQIERDIKQQLIWSAFTDATTIDVSVLNGVATLTGTVGSLAEFNAAIRNAYEGGARRVISQLAIAGGETPQPLTGEYDNPLRGY